MNVMTPEAILGLGRSFIECRVLLTAAELDLFSHLAPAPLTAEEVTTRIRGDRRAVTMLLDALAAMELLEKRDGRYRTPPGIAPFLTADSPRSVLPMLRHSGAMWRRWTNLTRMARGEEIPEEVVPTAMNEADLRSFIGAMHVVGASLAAQVAAAVGPAGAQRFLDVGGASGTYTIAFLEAAPGMRATLFDRPPVVEMARERLEAAGLLDRVTLAPGDFYTDPLPGGHDLALLSAIIHQNSLAQNVQLYRKVHDALVPGGRLVIRDHVMSPDRTKPRSGALFAINMLVATPEGGTFTFEEIRSGLEEAGFTKVRLLQPDERMDGLIDARKP